MLRTVTNNSTIIITKYTWYHRYRENNPNHWRAAITAASEGGKKQTEMLWCYIGDLYTDTDYSFSWALISESFESSSCHVPSGSNWYGCMSFMT